MPRAPRRATRLAILGAVAASGLAIAGCAPVHAGAAATVGNDRISVNQVKSDAATMLADSNSSSKASADQEGLQRSVLSKLIVDNLIGRAAAQKGITVSEADVENTISTNGGSDAVLNALGSNGQAVAKADLHDFVYYGLLQQKLGDELVKDKTIQTAHLRIIAAADKTSADAALAQVQADPSQFAAAASKYSQDAQSAANGGDIGSVPVDQLPEPLKGDLSSKSTGAIFEEVIQSGYYVIQVVSLDDEPVSGLDSQTSQQYKSQAVQDYLGQVMKSTSISVSPRYGKWDPASFSVVASTGALSSSGPSSPPPSAPASPDLGGQ